MRFSLSCFDPLRCFLTPFSQHLSQWQGLWRVLLTESVKINNIISTLSQFSINEFEVHHSRHIHHIRSASKTSDQTQTWCNTTHSKENLESSFRNNRSTNDQDCSCMSQFGGCASRMCSRHRLRRLNRIETIWSIEDFHFASSAGSARLLLPSNHTVHCMFSSLLVWTLLCTKCDYRSTQTEMNWQTERRKNFWLSSLSEE